MNLSELKNYQKGIIMSNELFNSSCNNKPKKLRQEIIVKMTDGTIFCGRVFLGLNERVPDVMNNPNHFLTMELENNQILVLSKRAISAVDTLERTQGASVRFDKKMFKSILYQQPINKTNNITKPATALDKGADSLERHPDKKFDHYTKILREINDTLSGEKRVMDNELNLNIQNVIEKIEKCRPFK